MQTVSDIDPHTTRKLAHVLLQRVAAVKNSAIAQAIRKDESTVSRIVSGEAGIRLEDLQAFLDSLGFKVVGKGQVCVDIDEFRAYRALAARYMSKPAELNWDESEPE